MTSMKRRLTAALGAGMFAAVTALAGVPAAAEPADPASGVLREDFNGPAGAAPDPAVWGYETGRGFEGWGNWEKQFYTDTRHNSWLDGNGNLVIQAKYEEPGATMQYGDDAGNAHNWETQWTSARLKSQDKFEFQYGRAEARIKVPQGAGMWPAFWTLGADNEVNPWPESGEIDIFEGASWARTSNLSNAFGGKAWNDKRSIAKWTDQGKPLGDDFHTYALEWTPDTLQFFFDGKLHHEVSRAAMGEDWRFDKPQYLILNVAVGGNFGGRFDADSGKDATMLVDYVEVSGNKQVQDTGALAITKKWDEKGGLDGQLGNSPRDRAATDCTLRRDGCVQRFDGGLIYWTPSTGAHNVWGRIHDRYAGMQWETSHLGYPTTDEFCGLARGGCGQHFEGGSLYWSPATDAHPVVGEIRNGYARLGWERGKLGYPLEAERCGLRDGGCVQAFQGGLMYWSPRTGTHAVWGRIGDKYANLRWETSRMGYPTGPEFCGLRGGGCAQRFQDGMIYWSPRSDAHPVWGMIGTQYAHQRWEQGPLGYPTSDERITRSGWEQDFQGGRLTWRR